MLNFLPLYFRSLDAGYPAESAYKLQLRLIKCREEAGNVYGVKEGLEGLRKSLDEANLSKKKKAEVMLEGQQSLVRVKERASLKADKYLKLGGKKEEEEGEGGVFHKEFLSLRSSGAIPCSSEAVALRHEAGLGRYAVAARDVEVGEVLASCAPVVHLLLPRYALSRCAACAAEAPGGTPIPCEGCASAVFCSDECKQAAKDR